MVHTMSQDYSSQMPAEITLAIIREFSQSFLDLRKCRLVSKCVSPVAEELLFRELRLNRNIESFQKFEAIAHDCRLSKHVTKIVYSGLRLNISRATFDLFFTMCDYRLNGVRKAQNQHTWNSVSPYVL